MISAWDIYWVMQLDSISAALGLFAFVACIFGGLAYLMHKMAAAYAAEDKDAAAWAKATRASGPVLLCGFLAWGLNTMLPSTKTAAAMIVLPAIANNKAIQHEAADLYGIAKDALREIAKPKQEAAK